MPADRPVIEVEFIELVRQQQASLRAFIRMLGADSEWVDDLAQETFLVAYRQFHEFDASRDFARWLRGIARNIVANETRKEGRRSRILETRLTDLLMSAPEVESSVETKELVSAMNECLQKLPEKCRELLRSRYQNDENASILSQKLNTTPEVVRQVLMKARLLLQKCILGRLGEIRV